MNAIDINPSFEQLCTLSNLPMGKSAVVHVVSAPRSDENIHLERRLAEVGFIPGEPVRVLRKVTGGEPIAVRIGGSTFALRKKEAECIQVMHSDGHRK